jgi:plastocyanin
MTTTHRRLGVGLAASLLGALVALALLFSVTARAAPQQLVATVGPGYTISLKSAAGKRVTALTRGTYTLVVKDRSNDHNFFIRGPGISRSLTGVDFVGTKTITVRFAAGRYAFVCTPHSDDMRGAISVR